MIQARALTKCYGRVRAVDGLTFDVLPGRVTGFLGPNGAGKSTTMRLILGLEAPTAGSVTVGGRRYRDMRRPLRDVGSMLEAAAVHPGPQRARDRLAADLTAAKAKLDRQRKAMHATERAMADLSEKLNDAER